MFGDLEMQEEFAKRHLLLLNNVPNLKALADAVLSNCQTPTFEDLTLRTLGRIAMEDDFWSIILLCSNGFDHSAKQVLRGMFERVVTLSYLAKHPNEIELFNDYFRIDQRKFIKRYERELGLGAFSAELVSEVERHYNEVKEKFMITNCEKCKTKRLNHMWSKQGLIAMAQDVGIPFKTIEAAYYIPLEEAHPKIDALFHRTKEGPDGSVSYDERPGIEQADDTVLAATQLQFEVFKVLQDHFKLEMVKEQFDPYLVGLAKYVEHMKELRQGQKPECG